MKSSACRFEKTVHGIQLRFVACDSHFQRLGIDLEEHIAFLYRLIFVDEHFDHASGNLRCDVHLVGLYVRVVGRHEPTRRHVKIRAGDENDGRTRNPQNEIAFSARRFDDGRWRGGVFGHGRFSISSIAIRFCFIKPSVDMSVFMSAAEIPR